MKPAQKKNTFRRAKKNKKIEEAIKEALYGDGATKKPILKKGSTESGNPTALSKLELYRIYESATGEPSERLSAVLKFVERE